MEQVQPSASEVLTDDAQKTSQEPQSASGATTSGSSQQQAQPTSAPDAKGVTICGVCEKTPSKYKCPRCYLPYCSVACNKIHKENHPPDPEPKSVEKPVVSEAASNGTGDATSNPSNPFHALEKSEQLQRLFRKYPCLQQKLLDIYAATQPPREDPEKRIPASLMQGVPKKDSWNHDIGIKKGKEALRRARRADGEAGEAIREYSELVLHLINTQDGKGEVATLLQQQAAQEDTKLIEQLLAQERR
ncbi:zinc finger domain-containing protein [Pochonia chlamydosporia 170]|uniref:Zinc finger domain-containing protein n=1 Tax=Pochonia chlamydosporia 170 TaxID=1380566 RepID=A0A179G922_METCM|nr:zinc finger domain-containing protein [Pochonia chlamydosporia 170]OAQ74307.1 zinc finger domain-containing protein [Pochonia chlamydosporia 170]